MTQPGDSFVLYLIIGIIIYLLIRKWLPFTLTDWLTRSKQQEAHCQIKGKIPSILEKNGYELVEEKTKIPMTIQLDDEDYESRLYVDYIAKKEDDQYLVFVEKARKPFKKYGPGLRDTFLPYYLLYRPDGILYVKKDHTIHVIEFEIEDLTKKNNSQHVWMYLLFFLLGMVLVWVSR